MTELHKWLRENLGTRCLAPATGTDQRALTAAQAIVELYAYDIYGDRDALDAFRTVVSRMQPSAQHLAYHSIAKVLDWGDRGKLWYLAGLPSIQVGRCKHEPQKGVTDETCNAS